jgi:hypothetical protein
MDYTADSRPRDILTLRQQLVAEMTKIAGSAALSLAIFELHVSELDMNNPSSTGDFRSERSKLEAVHFKCRVRGWVVEKRLEVHFGKESRVVRSWHKTLDALNLWYLALAGQLDPSVDDYEYMYSHTQIPASKRGDCKVMRQACEAGLESATQDALTTGMRSPNV